MWNKVFKITDPALDNFKLEFSATITISNRSFVIKLLEDDTAGYCNE